MYAYFNSIKVRLELIVVLRFSIMHIYFNSIKVRLELKGKISAKSTVEFQFHKGAIRTGFINDENFAKS